MTTKPLTMLEIATYLLCPDKTCELFSQPTIPIPCESNCPCQDRLIRIIICQSCKQIIELAGDHSALCRVDHHCASGKIASNFQRLNGYYIRIFKKPV